MERRVGRRPGKGGLRIPLLGGGLRTSTLIIKRMKSGGFCCQVPPNPACRSLTRQDFKSVFQTALRSLGNRSIVVVCNYEFGPITAEPCRAKARPLRPRRSCFAPESRISGQQSAVKRLID